MEFGIRLKELRIEKQLSLKTLADTVNVNHAYLSRIEAGHISPSENVVRQIAKALGHDENELMILTNRIPPSWRPTIQKSSEINVVLNKVTVTEGISDIRPKRKSPNGKATNDLVFSSQLGNNDELFPKILSLYVKPGSNIADVTYGKGVFWRNVPSKLYKLHATDAQNGVDCRKLPYKDMMMDVVVLDPPYMHTPGGTAHNGHQNYENYYKNNVALNGSNKKYHEAVLDLYFKAGNEAYRILKTNGIFIVKCADEVCANQQRLTHVELINEYSSKGFIVEDLFVLLRLNKPGVSRMIRQIHARKNHSYFLVFRKCNGRSRWYGVN